MLKILCAADLHIGRRPSRLGAAGAGLSAAQAWLDLVDSAIAERVGAVLLAGDVIDHDNRFFEAYGPLERGARRLKEAGIPLVAVAGNHDHQSLHDVAADVGRDHLVVIGRGGTWERHTLRAADGTPLLHVDGWSFPDARCAEDPTACYSLAAPADGAPVVGLLHCDLDGTEPHYAPVSHAALTRIPVSAWVLGHIHAPALRNEAGRAPTLYAGSPLALDPGETGVHGPWTLELEQDRPPRFRQLKLSRVRYDGIEISLDGVAATGDPAARVASALNQQLATIVEEGCGMLEVLCCRLRLTGRTPLHGRLTSLLKDVHDLDLERGGVRLIIEPRLTVDTRAAVDLDDLARTSDAPALLATLLKQLDQGDGRGAPIPGDAPEDSEIEIAAAAGGRDLLDRARREANAVAGRTHYARLDTDFEAAAPARIATALRRQAELLLDELMRQKESV